MSTPVKSKREEQRNERTRLNVGDRVVGIGSHAGIVIGTVKEIMSHRVTIAWPKCGNKEHWIDDGLEVAEIPTIRLRGVAKPEDFKALEKKHTLKRKTHWTRGSVAREKGLSLWPRVLHKNCNEIRGEPGIHAHKGNWADQLRCYDSRGVLRGVLLFFHEPEDPQNPIEYEWLQNTDAKQCYVIVDPEYHRHGIGIALLEDAINNRNWPIDFSEQTYSPAGRALVNEFLRRWPHVSRKKG